LSFIVNKLIAIIIKIEIIPRRRAGRERENDGPSKLQGMKLQDMKLQDMKLPDMKMQEMNMTDQKWRQGVKLREKKNSFIRDNITMKFANF